MTKTLKDLIAQRRTLNALIERTQQSERADAIVRVRDLMAQNSLSIADLALSRVPQRDEVMARSPVAAKYRDKETGATWSGRGRKPRWLTAKIEAGQPLETFKV